MTDAAPTLDSSPSPDHPSREAAVQYAVAVALVAAAHVAASVGWTKLGPATFTVFLAAVVISAVNGGYGPSLLATVLASLDIAYSFIEPYHSFVINADDLIFIFTFAALALLTSFLQARRRSAETSLRRAHNELERRVRARTGELERSQAKLGLLVNDLLVIAEHEQQRIGHDLHDGLGQELTGISMLGVALEEQLRQEKSAAVDDAEQVASLLQQALRHTRDLARGLCPVDLEDEGLAVALERLAARIGRLPGVTCAFGTSGEVALPAVAATHLFRIAQEAASNALRHGHARRISIELYAEAGQLTLTITDEGSGFAEETPAGMGLRLMRHRAETIGGVLEIVPSPAGTRVCCVLALPKE